MNTDFAVRPSLWFDDSDAEEVEFEAANSLSAEMAKISGLKPFPAIAQKVAQMVADPDCRLDELAQVIKNDPAMAARLMRLANSALFRLGHPANSLDQALIRLGTGTLYQMVTAISVMGLFPAGSKLARLFREHCVGVAVVARHLARSQAWPGAEQLFLCGLMHDIGKLLVTQTGELDYATLGEQHLAPWCVHIKERELLGYDHAVLGGHVMGMWELPEGVVKTVAWHHSPERAYEEGGDIALCLAYTVLADLIDPLLQRHDQPPKDFFDRDEVRAACAVVKLTPAALAASWGPLIEQRELAVSMF